MNENNTLSPLIVKYVDYGTENYIKALLEKMRTDRKLQNINPYIGVLQYPSSAFLKSDLSYGKTTQSIGMYYVGHIEMLLPKFESPVNTGCAYTLLSFELDGVTRKFLQISNGEQISQGLKFSDYVLGLFKGANDPIPFNRNAFHVLTDIEISGATYAASDNGNPFNVVTSGLGAFTPAIEFELAISGYRCLMT
jgi:hypothetical protein